MELTVQRRLFVLYIVLSTMAAGMQFYKLYDITPNLYVLGINFSKGNSLLVLSNLVVAWTLLVGAILQRIIFGELRLIEIEHLYERSWTTVIGLIMSGSTYTGTENSFFIIFLGCCLLFTKTFHCILTDRLDALIQQYYQRNNSKFFKVTLNRVVLTLGILLELDYKVIKSCIDESFIHRSTILLVVAFEFVLLLTDLLYSAVNFSLNVFELYYLQKFPEEEVWTKKVWINSIAKLVLGLLKVIAIPTLLFFFAMLGTIPFNLIGELFRSLYSFGKSVNSFYMLIKSMRKLNSSLGYPTAEELEAADLCIICRDDMVLGGTGTSRSVPRKLRCGHILHDGCVRSWLEMSNACPTCRKEVITKDADKAIGGETAVQDNIPETVNEEIRGQNIINNDGGHDNDNDDNDDNDNNNDNQSLVGTDFNSGNLPRSNVNRAESYQLHNDSEIHNFLGNSNNNFDVGVRNCYLFPSDGDSDDGAYYEDDFYVHEREETDFQTLFLRDERLKHIESVINQIGSLNMTQEQHEVVADVQARLNNLQNIIRMDRGMSPVRNDTEIQSDDEFVLEVPPHTNIPTDWTVFPIEKEHDKGESTSLKEGECIVKLGNRRGRRLSLKVVKNGRIFSKDTFNKYVR